MKLIAILILALASADCAARAHAVAATPQPVNISAGVSQIGFLKLADGSCVIRWSTISSTMMWEKAIDNRAACVELELSDLAKKNTPPPLPLPQAPPKPSAPAPAAQSEKPKEK